MMISINEKKVNYSQKHVVTFQLLIALEKNHNHDPTTTTT